MVTTVQVNERTRRELLKIAAELEARLERRVSFDEAIMTLIEQAKRVNAARTRFETLYGTLGPDDEAWLELRRLRREERERLERIARATD